MSSQRQNELYKEKIDKIEIKNKTLKALLKKVNPEFVKTLGPAVGHAKA